MFGGKEESAGEKERRESERRFDILKYDGLRALRSGETDYAVRCLRQALDMKEDPEAMGFLAEALMAARQAGEAYEVLERLSVLLPGNIGVRLGMAQTDEALQDFERMDRDCAAALQIDGSHAGAMYLHAKARHALHDDLGAVALLTRALQLDEALRPARLLRAEILQAMGSLHEAEDDADCLLQEPEADEAEDALLLKAGLRLQQNDAEQAILYYNKVKTQNPLLGEAYTGLSAACCAAGQPQRALETMNEALEVLPDYAGGYHERGRVRLLLGDKEGAMDDVKRALEADPQAARTFDGTFSNLEQEMNREYRQRNPFGF